VDGCSRLRGFLVVVLPLLRPALVAVAAGVPAGLWGGWRCLAGGCAIGPSTRHCRYLTAV